MNTEISNERLAELIEVAAGLEAVDEEKALTELAARREADRWIPVSEKLPKKGQRADLWIKGEPHTVTFYDTSAPRNATKGRTTAWIWDGERWCATGGLTLFLSTAVEVTHWRPLPAPPEAT